MVVDDFHVVRVAIPPPEADAPLGVDPDTVLSLADALECLPPIGGRDPHVVEDGSGIEAPDHCCTMTLSVI